MSEIEPRFVKHGLWVDLGKASSMGKTITTDTRTGTLIVALLAVLCSMATAHLWYLITFLIHLSRSDGRPSDGLFRQQQVMLRALPPPSAVVTDYIKLYWSWKSTRVSRGAIRSFGLPLLATSFTVGTVVSGVFSSYIVDTTNLQILASSPFCGPVNISDNSIGGINTNYTPIVQSLADPLAQECYGDTDSSSARCNIYPRPRIPFKVERDGCPWPSSQCIGIDQPAVTMDSRLLDMNKAFGMNLPSNEGVYFRKRTTCSVLPSENRTTVIPATAYSGYSRPPLPEEELLIYHFGEFPGNGTWKNATFVASLASTNVTDRFLSRKFAIYTSPEWYYKGVLEPLPEMKRDDADLVLKLVVKNRVTYDIPVNDPLFAAHKEFTTFDETDGANVTFYFSDFPASVVGCVQQYQFCSAKDDCTELSYLPRQLTQSDFPRASSLQLAALDLLITSAYNFDIATAQSFQASSLMRVGGYISALPDDQWVQEVVGWESNTWASLQIAIAEYATGVKARDAFADSYYRQPETDGEKKLCSMQKMKKSGGFVNINVFGLAFVSSFAFLVVLLDIVLLRCFIHLSRFRRTRWLGPRIERWIQDGALQLQRRAYEADGQGPWKDLDKEVPTTARMVQLYDLPLETYAVSRQGTEQSFSKSSVKK